MEAFPVKKAMCESLQLFETHCFLICTAGVIASCNLKSRGQMGRCLWGCSSPRATSELCWQQKPFVPPALSKGCVGNTFLGSFLLVGWASLAGVVMSELRTAAHKAWGRDGWGN